MFSSREKIINFGKNTKKIKAWTSRLFWEDENKHQTWDFENLVVWISNSFFFLMLFIIDFTVQANDAHATLHWTLFPYQDPPQHQDVAHAARQRQDVSRHHGGMSAHPPCATHCSNDTKQRRHKHHGPTEIFLVWMYISLLAVTFHEHNFASGFTKKSVGTTTSQIFRIELCPD